MGCKFQPQGELLHAKRDTLITPAYIRTTDTHTEHMNTKVCALTQLQLQPVS